MKRLILLCTSMLLFAGQLIFAIAPASAADITIKLKPGQTVSIATRFWCLDYGKNYPPIVVAKLAQRAPDGVVAVLEMAIAKGTVIGNPYQTQLAIWRVTTGQFNDYGNKGTALAEELYTASLSYTVPPIPTDKPTLADLIANGTLTITIASFTAQKDLINPGLTGPDFFGTGMLVITNTTQEPTQFLLLQGSVFDPPAEVDAQSVTAEFQVPKPNVPPTGADLQSESGTKTLVAGIGGICCIVLAAYVFSRARRNQQSAA